MDLIDVALNELKECVWDRVVVPRIVWCAEVLEDRGDNLSLDSALCPVGERFILQKTYNRRRSCPRRCSLRP